jgi:hypothetical protein
MIKPKRGKLENVLICYHGCVPQNQVPFTYRQKPGDIQEHVSQLLEYGYTFVLPDDYARWQRGEWSPDYPIACLHFDDGLESVNLILPWLAGNGIPFGIAMIGRRQRKRLPETDFISWAELKTYVDGGLCELMSHTYNMHHLTVGAVDGSSQPIMQGPWWVDNGIVMYRDSGDTRHQWDLSFIDQLSWGFPLFGTDPSTMLPDGKAHGGSRPITSEISFVASASMDVAVIRFWSALGVPSGGGYDVNVIIKADGVTVFDGVFSPINYTTRVQWQEREMATITLDTPFSIVSGDTHVLTFETQNTGDGLLRIYALPDMSGDFALTSDCVSVKPGVTNGNAIIDYPPGVAMPARPVMILGDGTGALVSESVFLDAVEADLAQNNAVIANWLNAQWTEHKSGFNENEPMLYVGVAFGTYADGTLVDSKFRYVAETAHTATTLSFKFSAEIGPWYPIAADCYIGTSESGPWTKVGTFAPNYSINAWQEIDLSTDYAFSAGVYWVRFVTNNPSPYSGQATLLRILIDRVGDLPDSVENTLEAINNYYLTHSVIPGAYFLKTISSDIWAGLYMIGRAFIKTYSYTVETAETPKRLVYPFGAYSESGDGPAQLTNTSDVSPAVKAVFESLGLEDGHATWPSFNRVQGELNEPGLRKTEWAQSRLLMYGDIDIKTQKNNLAAYTGAMWPDVQHGGVKWQTSVEPDVGGNATIRKAYGALSYVDFDTYTFKPSIVKNGFDESKALLYVGAAFGTYSDLSTVDSAFLFEVKSTHSATQLGFKTVNWSGTAYAVTAECYVGPSETGPWTNIGTVTPALVNNAWQSFALDAPYTFVAGETYWIRFDTTTAAAVAGIFRIYVDQFGAAPGAYYQKTDASDIWSGLYATGRGFLRTNTSTGIYRSALNDGGRYLIFDNVTGTITTGQTITGPSGSGTVAWFNGDYDHPVCKITGYTGSYTAGETWATGSGSGVVSSIASYPDDKGFLQDRGIKCLLYFTNFNYFSRDFDGGVSSGVVNNYASYVTDLVNIVVADGWDGAVIDIENVFAADRTAATAFIIAAADALHAVKKLCHIAVPAITGTDYDNPAWTGWCDYVALIKRVDLMHVMSYTEAGGFGSDAGPHAPADFWNLVYFYMLTTIPARLRKRVLVGCNAFSHVWDPDNNVSYADYFTALASALLRGAMIETVDYEGTWSKFGYTAYMGVPNTAQRAVDEALRKRFGGVGSWKADDGNLYSMFPHTPQIGRVVKRLV